VFKPPLICEGLQAAGKGEESSCFIEFAFSLGKVSKVEEDSPMHFSRDVINALEYELHYFLEAHSLNVFKIFVEQLVLLLRNWSFKEFLLKSVNLDL